MFTSLYIVLLLPGLLTGNEEAITEQITDTGGPSDITETLKIDASKFYTDTLITGKVNAFFVILLVD